MKTQAHPVVFLESSTKREIIYFLHNSSYKEHYDNCILYDVKANKICVEVRFLAV